MCALLTESSAPDPHVQVRKVGYTFAAEVFIPSITFENVEKFGQEIYQTYLDNKVLVFKNQDITPELFVKFGEIFGVPEQHHVVQLRHPEQPNLTYLSNQNEEGRSKESRTSGQGWHSDYSYKLVPGSATMLYGVEIPPAGVGGDTLFCDAEAAFLDLPNEDKVYLRTLRVIHHYRWSPDRNDPWARWKYIGSDERKKTPPVSHPLIRRHPDTGRETLFLQPRIIGSVVGIEGFSNQASADLIDQLIDYMTSEKYVYRHRWSPKDIVVWDNRCLLHSATTKDLDEKYVRKLLRLTTAGSPVIPALTSTGDSRIEFYSIDDEYFI